MDHVPKIKVTLRIMKAKKIPQQKENLIKALKDESLRESWVEVAIIIQKTQVSSQPKHSRGKVPQIFISIGIESIIIHNYMVDSGANTTTFLFLSWRPLV